MSQNSAYCHKLIVENISKSYAQRQILRSISLQLNSGEIVGLFGPNGAGKTTCFNIISGLIQSDVGKLLFDEYDITNAPMYLRGRIGISYLPQEASIFRGLSVIDNIKAIVEIHERDKDIIEQTAESLLVEFSIDHLKYVSALALSGGERRRLEIARTLASNPKFVMLDEPLAGIDPLAIIDIKHLITHLKARNIGVLITDHNVREVLDIVDRAYIIYDGKVLMDGEPAAVISSDHVREVYLGRSFNIDNI